MAVDIKVNITRKRTCDTQLVDFVINFIVECYSDDLVLDFCNTSCVLHSKRVEGYYHTFCRMFQSINQSKHIPIAPYVAIEIYLFIYLCITNKQINK